MEIMRATTIDKVLECIPIELDIKNKEDEGVSLKDMLTFIEGQLNKPYFGFYIVYEQTKIIGMLILFFIPIKGMEQIQIIRIWYDHHYKEVPKEFEKILRQWIKETKTRKVTTVMSARRKGKSNMGRIKALMRHWKFSIRGIELERRF